MLDEKTARDSIIVALDCTAERAHELARLLSGRAGWVKVGMTLFYREGPSIVEAMREQGFKVFLDLKLHDIPFQVRGAAESAAWTGADLLSIHGLGGPDMIAEARSGVEQAAAAMGGERTKLVAITVLTSMDNGLLKGIGIDRNVHEEAELLARSSYEAGSDGIVCSPKEAARMRELLGPDALIVTPGIRPTGSDAQDQRRIATPAYSIQNGASKLVVGRPITGADDPVAAVEAIVAELCAQ